MPSTPTPVLMAILGLSVSVTVHAQQTEQSEITEHVLVTAPLHKTAAETAMPVTVLTAENLFDKATDSIGATLQFEPGITSSSFGTGVGQPVIRGQGGPRVNVIQNGILIQDASSVSPDHAVATEPMLAESIEVIRGPATLLYGSGTIGGVVNVIDNRIPSQAIEGIDFDVEYRHNTNNDENVGVMALDAGAGKFVAHFDAVYRRSNDVRIPGEAIDSSVEDADESTDGFIGNSDAQSKAFTGGFSVVDDWGYVGVAANRIEDSYGLPPGVHAHEEEHGEEEHGEEEEEHGHEEETIRLDLTQNRFDIKSELYHPAAWLEALRLHLVRNDYEHRELEGDEVGTTYKNDSWNFRGEMVHHEMAGFHGALGIDYGQRTFSADGEEAFIVKSDIRNAALFLLEDWHRDKWTVEFGFRLEQQNIDPDDSSVTSESHTPVSLSLSGLWAVTDNNNLSLAFSRAQRAPQVEELYSNVTNEASGDYVVHAATGAVEVGDTDLNVETSYNAEFGWRFLGERFSSGINVYYNRFDDYIYLQNSGLAFNPEECGGVPFCTPGADVDGPPVYFYKQQAATFRGVELDMNIGLYQHGTHDLNLDVFGDYVQGTLDDTDEDVPRMPPARIGTQLNYKTGAWWLYGRVFHGTEQDSPGENETSTAAWTRLDAAIYYDVRTTRNSSLLLFVKGNNLANEEIRNSTSFLRNVAPEPGRGVEFGFRFSI